MTARVARLETPLKRLMEHEGRSQTWLAGRLGVARQQVWMWIHGIHEPAAATKSAIAQALGRSVDEVFPDHAPDHRSEAPASDISLSAETA